MSLVGDLSCILCWVCIIYFVDVTMLNLFETTSLMGLAFRLLVTNLFVLSLGTSSICCFREKDDFFLWKSRVCALL